IMVVDAFRIYESLESVELSEGISMDALYLVFVEGNPLPRNLKLTHSELTPLSIAYSIETRRLKSLNPVCPFTTTLPRFFRALCTCLSLEILEFAFVERSLTPEGSLDAFAELIQSLKSLHTLLGPGDGFGKGQKVAKFYESVRLIESLRVLKVKVHRNGDKRLSKMLQTEFYFDTVSLITGTMPNGCNIFLKLIEALSRRKRTGKKTVEFEKISIKAVVFDVGQEY
ncbi:hypothetical protein HK098_002800, partial [Nowakowskiella sp. JEL0407]